MIALYSLFSGNRAYGVGTDFDIDILDASTRVDATGFSAQLKVSGSRRVFVGLKQLDPAVDEPQVDQIYLNGTPTFKLYLMRDSTDIAEIECTAYADSGSTNRRIIPARCFFQLDSPPAGTYTYKVQLFTSLPGGTSFTFALRDCRLEVAELID